MIVTCLCCQKPFTKADYECRKSPRHFCSRSCSAKTNNFGRVRTVKQKPVKEKKNRTTQEIKLLTLGELQAALAVKGKHTSWKNSQVRVYNRNWNRDLTKLPCQRCKYSFHVELAHIKSLAEFSTGDLIKEINSPSNILVLCRNCHWEFDNGKLKLEAIPAR